MGRNNQQRRAARAKERARRRASERSRPGARSGGWAPGGAFGLGDPAGWGDHLGAGLFETGVHEVDEPHDRPPPTPGAEVVRAVEETLDHLDSGREYEADAAIAALRLALTVPPRRRAGTALLRSTLTESVGNLWAAHWEPADLLRVARREGSADATLILGDAMADSLARFARSTVDPRWWDQLRAVDARVWWSPDSDYLQARATAGMVPLVDLLLDGVRLQRLVRALPRLEPIGPQPGQWVPSADAAIAGADERVLERVRALLAKAESTTFEAEAETFTAGAQALMSRHSIDHAMLAAASRPSAEEPAARRIGVERPYEAPKVALLNVVADANRCRIVWSKGLGFVTVVGHHGDLRACETIFTSLQVQATRAMAAHGSRSRGGQSRTRSFRTSFLTAFAQRIGERLGEAADQERDAAVERHVAPQGAGSSSGRDLVRVLAERDERVDAAIAAMFPDVVKKPIGTVSNAEGWYAGVHAADLVTLTGEQSIDPARH